MIIDRDDEKEMLKLIGMFIAYHNMVIKKSKKLYGNSKKYPLALQNETKFLTDMRNNICHELWETIGNEIISVNAGTPKWRYDKASLQGAIDKMIEITVSLNK